MSIQTKYLRLLLILSFLGELLSAAPFVKEASFYTAFSGKDYYTEADGDVKDFTIWSSTMSSDGKVVAIYGSDHIDGAQKYKLLIHNFESTTEPVEVILPSRTGGFNRGAGIKSNADGSRIFFFATDKDNSSFQELYMLNALTGELVVIFHTSTTIENPGSMATDANGDYVYFNETDNGDRGHLWRVAATAGATPTVYINQGDVAHPSGGVVRFISKLDLSDDGQTIVFFGNGWVDGNGDVQSSSDRELFIKTSSGIRYLTNNDNNEKNHLVISGDGDTIVYSNKSWMVTHADSALNAQVQIEEGYNNRGYRPGITTDGTIIFAGSNPNGVSSPHAYLIKTDGSGREMIEPGNISIATTDDGYHLSGDGKRIFFKVRKYVYPHAWYNMTVGIFDKTLWSNKVPNISSVNYPSDMFSKLEAKERFDITIGVNDPQGDFSINKVDEVVLLPNGYTNSGGYGPIDVMFYTENMIEPNLYEAKGYRGRDWPSNDPVRVRFSVEDEDGNIAYADTIIKKTDTIAPIIMYLLN